jgi:hypothetical protein
MASALHALDTHIRCQDFFKNILTKTGIMGRNGNASDTLQAIEKNGGFWRGGESGNIAFTIAAGSHSKIILYNSFFGQTVGGTTTEFRPELSPTDARGLTLLHELAHAMYRNFHGVPFFMSSHDLDRNLYEKCFDSGQTPLPRGIT